MQMQTAFPAISLSLQLEPSMNARSHYDKLSYIFLPLTIMFLGFLAAQDARGEPLDVLAALGLAPVSVYPSLSQARLGHPPHTSAVLAHPGHVLRVAPGATRDQ